MLESAFQRKYPAQTRTDPIVLAGLLKYFTIRHKNVHSVSRLIATTLEEFYMDIVAKNKIKPFVGQEEAVNYLGARGMRTGSKRGVNAIGALLEDPSMKEFC